MREIHVSDISDAVAKLCIDANINLNADIYNAMNAARQQEQLPIACQVLGVLLENAETAKRNNIPICQDTGMAVVFLEIGQDVHVVGGSLENAVNDGVVKGYVGGYLRKSVVYDPISRVNTNDNTPAVIHYDIVPGDVFEITVAPKGFGSENMSALKMLKPSEGIDGVKKFVLDVVRQAGPNPCPPIMIGIGVGGTMEKCALLSKKALLRPVGTKNEDDFWAAIETELLADINALDIGPAGFGGITTAFSVSIETYPTHIAGLPVAVNIGCHVTRHATANL